MKKLFTLLALFSLLLQVEAQTGNKIIPLYSGKAPGSENWSWTETELKMGSATMVYNIASPTITVFEADKSIAIGTAVVVCPGGGFHFLSMDNEGYDVAKWLNQKGITAFVLKYRLVHCITNNPVQEFMAKHPNTDEFNKAIEPEVGMAIADGKAAVAYVRSHAGEWNLKKDHIGIMGFSAGGTVATGVSFLYDTQSRPDFSAPIYPYVGSFGKPSVPADAPPLFIAVATDDMFGFQKHCIALYDQWTDAKKSAELHIYRSGNHGFGMKKQNLPTDNWMDRFYEWLMVVAP